MSYTPYISLSLAETTLTFANNNLHWCYVRVTIAEGGNTAVIIASEAHIDPMQYWESDSFIYYKIGHFTAVVDGKREACLIWGNKKGGLGGGDPQVQSDWNATTGLAVILNKPTIPSAQVQSDWNASSGLGVILNKPTIPNTPQDGILDWDGTKYSPYAAQSAGKFDSSTTTPAHFNRLNFDGMFYARMLQTGANTYLSPGSLVVTGDGSITTSYPSVSLSSVESTIELFAYKNGSSHVGFSFETVPVYIGAKKAHSGIFQNGEYIKIDDEQQTFEVNMTKILFSKNLPVYADNATAIAAGLSSGRLYRTSDGTVKIVY